MLAVLGEPFDSGEHFFEIKWDGIRALAMIEHGRRRIVSRNGGEISERYPELDCLAGLPEGLVLDGEIVAFHDGRPDLGLVLRRTRQARHAPLSFIAFDVIYMAYESLTDLPFLERRARLEELIGGSRFQPLLLSEGVRSDGLALYDKACGLGLEGVVAKKLSSTYAPGKRNGAWVKIKKRLRAAVAVIGFMEKGKEDFQSILVAGSGLSGGGDGALRYLGRVGSGFSKAARARLNARMRERPRDAPIVACRDRALWIEPGVYCTVSFAELTNDGLFRFPVFEELIES